jgi:DNA-binding MarR family transcriptional regulator
MSDNVGTLLFKEKQLRLFLTLSSGTREWYLTDLAKAANVTYVHTSRFISKCEEAGLVASEVHGRTKRLYLTEKGRMVADSLSTVVSRISKQEKPKQDPEPQPV